MFQQTGWIVWKHWNWEMMVLWLKMILLRRHGRYEGSIEINPTRESWDYIIVFTYSWWYSQIIPLIERPKSAISSMDLTRNSAADMCEQRYKLYYTRSKSTWSKFLFLTDDRTNFFLVISWSFSMLLCSSWIDTLLFGRMFTLI